MSIKDNKTSKIDNESVLNYDNFKDYEKPNSKTTKTQKKIAQKIPKIKSCNETSKQQNKNSKSPGDYIGKHAVQPEKTKIKKKKLPKKTKIILLIIIFVLLLTAAICAIALTVMNQSFEEEPNLEAKQQLTATTFDQPFYMVIVGTDTREEDSSYSLEEGRSDTCMLARIDPINSQVTIISIPRDTKINLNGSTEKFNAAYTYGGIASTIEQVKKLCGVDVAHYAEVSFNGLKDVVDAVGGVEVNVTEEINDPHTDAYVGIGNQVLNGIQALSYARSRQFSDGDFTRTQHQRTLVESVIKKAFKMPLTDLPNIIKIAKKFIKTDLSLSEMLGLATQFKDKDKVTVYNAMVPSFTQTIDGTSYVVTDQETLERMMKMVENGEDPAMVEVVSGASIGSNLNAEELAAKQKQYYIDHPNSPGKATEKSYNNKTSSQNQNSSTYDYNNSYSQGDYYNYSGNEYNSYYDYSNN